MNIFEILEKREMYPADEFHRLVNIFNKRFWSSFKGDYITIKKLLDENFHTCSCRSSFLTIDDMLKSLEIDEKAHYFASWETLFTYCEILRNVIDQSFPSIIRDDESNDFVKMILDNMRIILEKTNHEWAKIKEGYVIVDKNLATTEAIECLEEKDAELALKMIEYNRVLLKGNLQRKREILVALADYTEPMNNDFKGTQYTALYSDSKFLVNAIDIRHNNSGKGDLPEKAKLWTPQEKEDWYDKTYQVLLTVILARKHMDVSKEIQDLKPAKN